MLQDACVHIRESGNPRHDGGHTYRGRREDDGQIFGKLLGVHVSFHELMAVGVFLLLFDMLLCSASVRAVGTKCLCLFVYLLCFC